MKVIKFKSTIIAKEMPKTEAEQIQDLLIKIETVIQYDREYLRSHQGVPRLYDCSIRYRAVVSEGIADVAHCLSAGEADADALVAWRCAELREAGVEARPYVERREMVGGRFYACVVLWPDGSTEDVVALLGDKEARRK